MDDTTQLGSIPRILSNGYQVFAPAWPHMDGEVEAIRRDPSALAELGITEIVDHYAKFIRSLDEPPILIGHSFGGLIVQLLLDRGLGAAGVAIDSATPKGIWKLPFSAIVSVSPVLLNPLNYWRTVALTFKQFKSAFANTMPETEARSAYARNAIPGPGRPVFQVALANFNPWAATKVNYHNHRRSPLLLIGGAKDRLVPAVQNRINYQKYARSRAITDCKEFSHRWHSLPEVIASDCRSGGLAGGRRIRSYLGTESSIDWNTRSTTIRNRKSREPDGLERAVLHVDGGHRLI